MGRLSTRAQTINGFAELRQCLEARNPQPGTSEYTDLRLLLTLRDVTEEERAIISGAAPLARASGTKRKNSSRRSNKTKGRGKTKNAKDAEENLSALSEANPEKNEHSVNEEDSGSEDSKQIRSKKIKREDVDLVKKEAVKQEDSSEDHKDDTRFKTVNHSGSKVKGTMAVKQEPRRYHREKAIKEELETPDEQKELTSKMKSGGHGKCGGKQKELTSSAYLQ